MKFLPDAVIARLQTGMQFPNLEGTRYRAIRFLGRGGMGEVWLVEDTVLQRQAAMKILRAESSAAGLAERLIREAQILAKLEHPGIVPVHDAGTLPDGRTFYCMKHVQGDTLDRHIAGMSLRSRVQLLQRIAEPLAFAHDRGVIHRDLKPGNIMVGTFGEVLIMDWGLARITGAMQTAEHATGSEALGSEATAHGAVLGTPGYMSPEQTQGDVGVMDERTDVFGLGAILGFMLDQSGSSTQERLSRPLRAIYEKATAREMSQRYASVQQMAADIGRYLEDLSISAYPENLFEKSGRFIKRNQVAVVLVMAYLVMRLLFILFSRR